MLPNAEPHSELVVIGGSAGALAALETLLASLPRQLSAPILVAIHAPRAGMARVAGRLNPIGPPVVLATQRMRLAPGKVYLAPGGQDIFIDEGRCRLGAPDDSLAPSVDVLFKSAAVCAGAGTLAVVLSGMGQDGLAGARKIAWAGGTVLAQDEGSSAVWGMPRAVLESGIAQSRGTPRQLGELIAQRMFDSGDVLATEFLDADEPVSRRQSSRVRAAVASPSVAPRFRAGHKRP